MASGSASGGAPPARIVPPSALSFLDWLAARPEAPPAAEAAGGAQQLGAHGEADQKSGCLEKARLAVRRGPRRSGAH